MGPEVTAIYCPLWHRYDHLDSWKGEGWTEWELLRNARPRYLGHRQ
ncbi:glycoside hydrolase family 99-like domain-containing protein, partial [Rhizobium ruizarguesonis]